MIDKHGDLVCAVADMDVLEDLPCDHLNKFKFWESEILLIDSNIASETLSYVLSRSSSVKHVVYEPISDEKSEKILEDDFLSKLTIFKPNLI